MTDTMQTKHYDLKRIVSQYKPRSWAFYDRRTGQLAISKTASVVTGSSQAPVSQLLQYCAARGVRTLYITGGRTAPDVPGYQPGDEQAVEGWWTAPLIHGWSIDNFSRDPWHVQYRRGEHTIDVLMSEVWYGDEHDATRCYQAHTLLGAMLRNTFDMHATLMLTPGRTGADLFQRSLPAATSYPPLTDHIRHILAHNFSQGRIEQPGLYQAETCPGLYVLDARLMYTTCLRHLPIGPAEHNRTNPEYKGFRKAVYRVSTRVPDQWDHIGLAPTWSEYESRTVWPRKPGQFIPESWMTGAELAVLYDYGWPVNILESIVYAPEDARGNDPARTFVSNLQEVIAWAELNNDDMVRAAARRLMINTVGYWARGRRAVIKWAPHGQEALVPRDALLVLPLKSGTRYTVQAPLDAATNALYRPEMAIQVWGAARAKLERQALMVRARDVLWLRHDSLVLPYDPGWPDTGKPGSWRVKWSVAHEVATPRTEEQYRKLMHEEVL